MIIIDRLDLSFLLYGWLRIDELFSRDRFAAHSVDTTEAMLDTAEKIGVSLLAPALRSGDLKEPWLDEARRVHVDEATKAAVVGIAESGLFAAAFEEEFGGLQLPFSVYLAATGILHSANSAATFYMVLTVGNARLIANAGSQQIFEEFGSPQVAAKALGTMCLSEPQAGSSLGDITTRALLDGYDRLGERYRISGTKMWISGGDHDVTGNIVHLVLAKIPNKSGGLPVGSRGVSLFVVPKILPDGQRNDVVVSGLNHKLGGRSFPNCGLNLGEGFATPNGAAGAIGWRVGEAGQGLALMFQMMNEARISVGMSSAMMAYRGYRMSLAYAHERRQGREVGTTSGPQIPIIEHVDVRRMLLLQKAIAEGALALVLYTARQQDEEASASTVDGREEASGLLGLLTPIAKSWPAEFAQLSLHNAVQVLGGAGYTRDFEVEVLYRDNRISAIYEGTTGIQGIDLVNRKIRRDGGRAYRVLRARVDATVTAAGDDPNLSGNAKSLREAWAAIDAAVEKLLTATDDAAAIVHATAFLMAIGHGVVGWIWVDIATLARTRHAVAQSEKERNYFSGKVKACNYFTQVELPLVAAWLAPLLTASNTALAMRVEEFTGESL